MENEREEGELVLGIRPDLFMHTVNNLLFGATSVELSEELNACVDAARLTGKQATLSLTLKIKPVGHNSGQYEIIDTVKASLPKYEKGKTLLFGTPEGNLQRENPRQPDISGLREADTNLPRTFKQV